MNHQPDNFSYEPMREHYDVVSDDPEIHVAYVITEALNRHLLDDLDAQQRIITWAYNRVHNNA